MKSHVLLTWSAVLGAAAILLSLLLYNGFWVDELYTLHAIRLPWPDMVMERLNRGHFPGYFTLVRLWYSLWPESQFELALRSMSAAFYLAAVGSFWFLVRRVLTQPASLLALCLFACNGVALRQAGEARMYTVVLFIAVWLVRCWYEMQQTGARKGWTILFAALTVVGFAVSPTVGVLVASMILVSLGRSGNRKLSLPLFVSFVLGMLVFIPGALLHVQTAVRIGISASKPLVFLAHPVALMPGVQLWDDYYKAGALVDLLLILGIPVTLYAIRTVWKNRRTMPDTLYRMALIAVLPLAIVTLCYPLVELFHLGIMGPPRYFLTLLPMASIVGAWAISRLPRAVLVHSVLVAFLLVNAVAIMTVRVERFRDVVTSYLKKNYKPGDGLVVTVHEAADGVELYVPGSRVDLPISRWEMDRDKLRADLATLSDRENVYLVWYRGAYSPLVGVANELWGDFETHKEGKTSGSLMIYKFKP